MHTGTLIDDLMNSVEQVEWNLRHQHVAEELRMPAPLDLRDPAVAMKPFLVGAA